jgi:cytochrome P450
MVTTSLRNEPPTGVADSPWGGWDQATRNDPYPLFEQMRSACPVHHVRLADGHEAWLVIGHAAARQALKDSRLSKDMVAARDKDPEVADAGLPGPDFARHMLAVDGEDHARLRHLVSRAFAPSRITALEPSIRRIANALLDDLQAGHEPSVDLIEGFAHPLPFRVIGELLGIPVEEQGPLRRWFQILFQPWSGSPPPAAVAASNSIVSYLEWLVDDHRVHPKDDLIGVLVSASDEYEALTQQELLSSLFQLIVAGQDTTTSLIGNGVVALLDHPDQLRLLLAEPERMGDAVEELIRFSAPVPHATFRVTTDAVELGGVEVPAGKQVLVCLGGANHDPSIRDAPAVLDIARPPQSHLGFGFGPHFCLGVHLARLEARVAFTALFTRFPALGLAVPRGELTWSHGDGLVLRGLADLPVHLTPFSPYR